MKSNIEPGCLAIVVGHPVAENNGKAVTVGRYLGKIACDSFNHAWVGKRWEVDRAIHAHSLRQGGPSGIYVKHIAEECLLRIDDYKEPLVRQTALEETV